MTPLFNAVFNGHLDCAKLLLDHGADKDAKAEVRGLFFAKHGARPCTDSRSVLALRCLVHFRMV